MSCNCEHCNCEKEKNISMSGEPIEVGEIISIECNCEKENKDFIVVVEVKNERGVTKKSRRYCQ